MARNIAVVVPSHKKELTDAFIEKWAPLFHTYRVEFILVDDSKDKPTIDHYEFEEGEEVGVYEGIYPSIDKDKLISNHCAGVRQLGFWYIADNLPEVQYIITLDTDVSPFGDPIGDHINALNMKVPISWISTASDFMRGFPYGVRKEAPVMISHGVWEGNYDWDAPSQLTKSHQIVEFFKGVVPKGIFAPLCGMNFAFRREALPYVYFAPVGQYKGAERFDDIWMGLELIKDMAKQNWAIITGYATVFHERASNVFTSLEKEAVGIRKNEEYWQGIEDEWYKDFKKKRKIWFDITND